MLIDDAAGFRLDTLTTCKQYRMPVVQGKYVFCVELQNGYVSLGHANLFIPSTLAGLCVDSGTGKINED